VQIVQIIWLKAPFPLQLAGIGVLCHSGNSPKMFEEVEPIS